MAQGQQAPPSTVPHVGMAMRYMARGLCARDLTPVCVDLARLSRLYRRIERSWFDRLVITSRSAHPHSRASPTSQHSHLYMYRFHGYLSSLQTTDYTCCCSWNQPEHAKRSRPTVGMTSWGSDTLSKSTSVPPSGSTSSTCSPPSSPRSPYSGGGKKAEAADLGASTRWKRRASLGESTRSLRAKKSPPER